MNGLGASDLEAINLNPTADHSGCVFPAITNSIAFFQSFLPSSSINDLDKTAEALNVFPNPVLDELVIDWDPAKNGMAYEIINATGQAVVNGHSYFNRLSIDGLPGGIYTIICTAGGETRMARFVHP
jgi:hypothetical protein